MLKPEMSVDFPAINILECIGVNCSLMQLAYALVVKMSYLGHFQWIYKLPLLNAVVIMLATILLWVSTSTINSEPSMGIQTVNEKN